MELTVLAGVFLLENTILCVPLSITDRDEDRKFCGEYSTDLALKAENHRDILMELNQLIVPARISAQVGDNRNLGCHTCDPWVPHLMRRRENLSYLTKQLTWQPWGADPTQGGHFVLDRELSEKADYFPDGYESVKENFMRLQARLQKEPLTAQFLNWRLEREYQSGYFRKYSPEELQEDLQRSGVRPKTGIYLPMTYVHNPKSESTPARNLQDPSRGRPLKGRFSGTRLNINQLIRVPNYTLITPLEFGVLQSFLPVLLGQ